MILVIAEKTKLKKKIAAGLLQLTLEELDKVPKVDGDYECPGDFLITGLEGHVKVVLEPHEYDIKWKDRSFNALPINPVEILYKPAGDEYLYSKYSHLMKLLPFATEIYHAGDPDREGQAIVDNPLYEYLMENNLNIPVYRLWLTNLSDIPSAFKTPLLNTDPKYSNLGFACKARTFADYLIGMNYSRALDSLFKSMGYDVNISIGRIQTPTLKMVVDRYRSVTNFKKKYHYSLTIELSNGTDSFSANLVFDNAIKEYLDEAGQITNKSVIDNIIQEISGITPVVSLYSKTRKKEKAPLPHTTPQLIAEAIRKFGYDVESVSKINQTLYENGAFDYPRTDYEYLSEDAFLKASGKLDQLLALEQFSKLNPDYSIKSRAWDNTKLKAHEGITPISTDYLTKATPEEINVFNLVATRFLMQFYPDHELDSVTINVQIGKYKFSANANIVKVIGWKSLANTKDTEEVTVDDEVALKIPELTINQNLVLINSKISNKETRPLKLFSEDSLMLAMCNVANYIDDIVAEYETITGEPYCENVEEYKKILRMKPEDGGQLGTGATQGPIIKTLRERQFIIKNDKGQLIPTQLGLMVIDFFLHKETIKLYSFLINPITSASWEKKLAAIQDGSLTYEQFIKEFKASAIETKVIDLKKFAYLIPKNADGISCPTCNLGFLFKRKYKDKSTGELKEFFSCTRHPDCTASFRSKDGKPVLTTTPVIITDFKCTKCSDGLLIKRTSISKTTKKPIDWYYCTNYNKDPKCEAKFFDDGGKPQYEPKPKAEVKLTGEKCPKCKKGDIVIRSSLKGNFKACNQYPQCDYSESRKGKLSSTTLPIDKTNKPWLNN